MASRGKRKFDREFKVEAARLITERGISIAQISRDLDVHKTLFNETLSCDEAERDIRSSGPSQRM